MSRIGQQTIEIPAGVTIKVDNSTVSVIGPKGTMVIPTHSEIAITTEENHINVKQKKETADASALQGTIRMILFNAVSGVTKEWSKALELVGVGYRAATNGKELTLTIGFSHPVKIQAPEGITFTVSQNTITIQGVDKQQVGETAAIVRRVRPPEPYKGKGIKYVGEHIRRKSGKAAKAVGGATG